MEEKELYYTCKECGGELDIHNAVDGMMQCKFCGQWRPVPKANTGKEAISFLRMGEHELDICKFDDAYNAYAKAAELGKDEPEAYFGMALAEFKVQQIRARKPDATDDKNAYRLQPICHIGLESTLEAKRFSQNENYLKAISLATPAQRTAYEQKCEEIEHIRSEFLNLRKKGIEYDCFICVKVTVPGTKEHTQDYKIADDIYTDLRRKGYKPFFSERELDTQTGSDYEAYILYALYCSECMLVVCGNEDYLKTPWVKNEYTRFMSMIADERKESDSIAIVYKGAPIEHLPGKSGKLQGINIDSLNAVNRIREYVDVHSPEGKKRREEEQRKRAEEERKKKEAEEKLIAEQQRITKALEEQQRMVEEKLKAIRSGDPNKANVDSLVLRGNQFLESGDMGEAKTYFNRVLDIDPQCAEAWWGLFLVEFDVRNGDELVPSFDCDFAQKILSSRNYTNAVKYAGEGFEALENFNFNFRSVDYWLEQFLDDLGADDFDDYFKKLTIRSAEELSNNQNYLLAKRFATGEDAEVIKNIENRLNSSESQWKLFLDSMHTKNENKLLAHLDDEMKEDILNNDYFVNAVERMDETTEERITAFRRALDSGELWWERFLDSMGVESEAELLGCGDGEKLKNFESNEFFMNAERYAEGELKDRIAAFREGLNSFEVWYKCFLTEYNAKDWNEIISSVKAIKVAKQILDDEYLNKALEYITPKEQALYKVENFIDALKARVKHYDDAKKAWQSMIKDCKCTKEYELRDIYIKIVTNDFYKQALDSAEFSCDQEFINHIRKFGEEQKNNVEANLKRRSKRKASIVGKVFLNIFVSLTLLLSVFTVVSIILAFVGVKSFENPLFIWTLSVGASNTAGIYAMLVAMLIVSLFVFLKQIGLFKAIRRRPYYQFKKFVIKTVFTFLVFYAALGSVVYFNSTIKDNTHFDVTDTYILKYKIVTVDTTKTKGYSVCYYYSLINGSTVVKIPYSRLQKKDDEESKLPVVRIGDSIFSGQKSIVGISIGGNVQKIGNDNFRSCSRLVEIVNGSKVPLYDHSVSGSTTYAPEGAVITTSSTKLEIDANGFIYYKNSVDGKYVIVGYQGKSAVVIPDIRSLDETTGEDEQTNGEQTGDEKEKVEPVPAEFTTVTIGASAFYGSVKSIVISERVTQINENAFEGCNFSTVTLPANLPYINSKAFNGAKVGKIIYLGSSEDFDSTADWLPEGVEVVFETGVTENAPEDGTEESVQ